MADGQSNTGISSVATFMTSSNTRRDISKFLSIFFAVCGLLSGLATYVILSGVAPIKPSREIVWTLFGLNIFMVTGLLIAVGWQLMRVVKNARRGRAGAQLHSRLVFLFSVIAVIPAVLVAIFAVVTLDQGLDSWFSKRTKTIIGNTTAVANAYLTEHRNVLRRDTLAMTRDLTRASGFINKDPDRFVSFLTAQAALRSVSQAGIISREKQIVFKSSANQQDKELAVPPEEVFELADSGKPVLITIGALAQVQVLQKLEIPDYNYFLLTTRFVSSSVLDHLARTDVAVKEYTEMESRRFEAQVSFAMIYVVIALVILLSAIWLGLSMADQMTKPIAALIYATQKMGEGDLTVRVKETSSKDEIGQLAKMFNNMAQRLGLQQKQLINTRDDLNERHRFTEMVLNGVSSGVIGVDEAGRVNHVNAPAAEILGQDMKPLIGMEIDVLLPELSLSLKSTGLNNQVHQIARQYDEQEHILQVFISRSAAEHGTNIVISFDDITDLISAQRTSAWSDIARRIAHEIKNPLTPIQLSAERIRSKFAKQIDAEPEIFEQCVETIIRQVGDIGRMVDEFASFARMPTAVMKTFNLTDIVRQAIFLQRVAHPHINYIFDDPESVEMEGDSRLISQALTNIFKNAAEAINPNGEETGRTNGANDGGKVEAVIEVRIDTDDERLKLMVIDNGNGWPQKDRGALLEPYNTSRLSGTGLGLAIVRKVVEDHGGKIRLEDASLYATGSKGACVTLIFSRVKEKTIKQQSEDSHVG